VHGVCYEKFGLWWEWAYRITFYGFDDVSAVVALYSFKSMKRLYIG
jgi:hypothetical protein